MNQKQIINKKVFDSYKKEYDYYTKIIYIEYEFGNYKIFPKSKI